MDEMSELDGTEKRLEKYQFNRLALDVGDSAVTVPWERVWGMRSRLGVRE